MKRFYSTFSIYFILLHKSSIHCEYLCKFRIYINATKYDLFSIAFGRSFKFMKTYKIIDSRPIHKKEIQEQRFINIINYYINKP